MSVMYTNSKGKEVAIDQLPDMHIINILKAVAAGKKEVTLEQEDALQHEFNVRGLTVEL